MLTDLRPRLAPNGTSMGKISGVGIRSREMQWRDAFDALRRLGERMRPVNRVVERVEFWFNGIVLVIMLMWMACVVWRVAHGLPIGTVQSWWK